MRGYASGGLVGGGKGIATPMGVSVYAPVTITPSQQSSSSSQASSDAAGRAYQQVVDRSIREGIARESEPGGIIWNLNNVRR